MKFPVGDGVLELKDLVKTEGALIGIMKLK